jgi:hypothetical protein
MEDGREIADWRMEYTGVLCPNSGNKRWNVKAAMALDEKNRVLCIFGVETMC